MLYIGTIITNQCIISDPKELLNRYSNDSYRIYLLSFPRSGNHWLRYCLQYLTGRQTFEHFPRGNFAQLKKWVEFTNETSMPIEQNKEIIWKVHFPYYFAFTGGYNLQNDKLIFLLRDYKECLIRQVSPTVFDGDFLAKYDVFLYFQNLQFYCNWPQNKKILIYYEDLIVKPEETLKRILNFLEEDTKPLSNFLKFYQKHKTNSLLYYAKNIGKPITLGRSIKHHAANLTKDKKVEIDMKIARAYPYLWEKYLKNKYAEPECK